jgi:hypothetical protein
MYVTLNPKKENVMPVKKTTKKAAKKTYPKKKTSPTSTKSKRITLDDLTAVVADTEARMARAREETERAFRKSREETEARIAKSREETEARIAKSREETDKAIRETSEEGRKTYALVKELTRNMGGLNNSFGFVVELVVVPKLRSAINTAGEFTFTDDKVLIDKDYTAIIGRDKKTVAEIDMFLFNDTDAMAVEIKAQLCEEHVTEHVTRLRKLRNHEEKADIVGKKLFGAIAGIYIHPEAAEAALENGLYLVEILEEEGKLNVIKPATCLKL